ncbi:MAG: hypothetical protein HRU32_01615 [Rhodobacteraceae bacterium]|nr:hypothetical protein [Paracoccaceae bacterium]
MANIYAREAALVLINCQFCKRPFQVAFSSPVQRFTTVTEPFLGPPELIRHQILAKTLRFGDPPNVDCCAGVTATSIERRVLEYWVKPYAIGEGVVLEQIGSGSRLSGVIKGRNAMNWRREQAFEIDITQEL